MESGIGIAISVAGLILAVPGALISFRDWRRGHSEPGKPASDASGSDAHKPQASADTSGPGAYAQVEPEPRNDTSLPAPTLPTGSLGEPVSVPRRVLSALIDVYSVILLTAGIAAILDPSSLSADTEADFTASTAASITAMVVVAGYIVIIGRTGRSPGKLVVGARLERADTPGKPPGIVRALLHILVALLLTFLSYLFALVREDRRAVHDLAAGTRVVRSR